MMRVGHTEINCLYIISYANGRSAAVKMMGEAWSELGSDNSWRIILPHAEKGGMLMTYS